MGDGLEEKNQARKLHQRRDEKYRVDVFQANRETSSAANLSRLWSTLTEYIFKLRFNQLSLPVKLPTWSCCGNGFNGNRVFNDELRQLANLKCVVIIYQREIVN